MMSTSFILLHLLRLLLLFPLHLLIGLAKFACTTLYYMFLSKLGGTLVLGYGISVPLVKTLLSGSKEPNRGNVVEILVNELNELVEEEKDHDVFSFCDYPYSFRFDC